MENITEKRVAEVVSENIKAAHVFKKYGIDFCCGGGISIQNACEKNNVNVDELLSDLTSIDNKIDRSQDYNSWKLDFLIDHIVQIHHSYVIDALPIMEEYANKVATVHGHHYPYLIEMKDIVNEVVVELSSHLQKEEKILFPYVKTMVEIQQSGKKEGVQLGMAKGPITVMEKEHDMAGDAFKQLRKLSNNYTLPEDACNTFRALFALLEEFENDIHQHIHLENNILFPKAQLLEKELMEH